MTRVRHWDQIYETRDQGELGWFEPEPATLPEVRACVDAGATSAIDVGAGASRLVDHLLDLGVEVTLLDVSSAALSTVINRLAGRVADVTMCAADVTDFEPDRRWDLWHDRATFHFLTDAGDRAAYRDVLDRSLEPGGHAVIATFDLDGPDMCAGLPVVRYDSETLAREFEDVLECARCRRHRGVEPGSDSRSYVICSFRKPIGPVTAPREES